MTRIAVLCLALLATACSREEAPGKVLPVANVKTAVAEMRDVELAYSAEAVVEAVRQSTVAAQVSGRIVDLRFDVGDYVKKGEVIVRINERAATQAVQASEASTKIPAKMRTSRSVVMSSPLPFTSRVVHCCRRPRPSREKPAARSA